MGEMNTVNRPTAITLAMSTGAILVARQSPFGVALRVTLTSGASYLHGVAHNRDDLVLRAQNWASQYGVQPVDELQDIAARLFSSEVAA